LRSGHRDAAQFRLSFRAWWQIEWFDKQLVILFPKVLVGKEGPARQGDEIRQRPIDATKELQKFPKQH
jgi:hypothetical protein